MKTTILLLFALLIYGCGSDPVSTPVVTDNWTSIYSKTFEDNDTSAIVWGVIVSGNILISHPLALGLMETRNADSVKCRVTAYVIILREPKLLWVYNGNNKLLNMDFAVVSFPPVNNNTVIFEQVLKSPMVQDNFTLLYEDYTTQYRGELFIKKVEVWKK